MLSAEWLDHIRGMLARSEKELADFKGVMAKQGPRRCPAGGERDVIGEILYSLEETVREYQSIADDR